jgi:hypothetical protein
MLAMVFHGTLGLPNYFGSLFLIGSMVCLFLFLRTREHRIEAETGAPWPQATAVHRWLLPLMAIAVLCALVALLLDVLKQ